ncbi:CaiB/BaiF CoA transferase family protein [Pyruvatibacter mobilis]|uniref:CaiB/BaiF CoA transferase family protein n=1 Tax=Pyruvatibacter mobilis TaxID=1712261 RepID=UPI003D10EB2D
MSYGALSGIRVLDLTQMLAGPYGTMMLADHGAEVIKIEPPHGDMTRASGPWFEDDTRRSHGGYFQSVNRNKRSVVLDLKSEDGRQAFLRLVEKADVVVENFRLGVMEKLGLGYETLSAINPKLVYGCLRGFGDSRTGKSPYADWPAFDVVAQAMGGIIGITGPDADTPIKIGPGVGDIIPGMHLAFGILTALHHARETGVGQLVDVAMADSVLATCERMVYQHSISGHVAGPEGNRHPFLCPFGVFPASDGFVTIAAPSQQMFETLCDSLDCPDIKADPRFADPALRGQQQDALVAALSAVTSAFSKADLARRLGGEVPFGPVLRADEIAADPHFAAREMLADVEQPGFDRPLTIAGVPVKLTRTPGGVKRRGPFLGEDTAAVLADAGLRHPQNLK